jgi:hypothetical protein
LESTAFVPRNIIYALHFSLHEKSIIDWGYLISSEVCFQRGNLKKTQNFYMTSYLVYAIAYGHVFEDLSKKNNVNFNMEPIYAWYSTLHRHKDQYNFTQFITILFQSSKSQFLFLVRQYYLLKQPPFSMGKDFMKLLKNVLLSDCLVVNKSLLFSHFMYQIDFLSRKCTNSINVGSISFMRRVKKFHTLTMENWIIQCKKHNPP